MAQQRIWIYDAAVRSFKDREDASRMVEYTALTIRAYGSVIEATGPATVLDGLNGSRKLLEGDNPPPVEALAEVELRPRRVNGQDDRRLFKVRVESLAEVGAK